MSKTTQSTPRKPGRPPSDNPKTTSLSGVRLTPDDLAELHETAVEDTIPGNFADWARTVLFMRAKLVKKRKVKT